MSDFTNEEVVRYAWQRIREYDQPVDGKLGREFGEYEKMLLRELASRLGRFVRATA